MNFFSGLEAQFAQSFIEGARWKLYMGGLGISFIVTLGAIVIGVALGVLLAVARTTHDQKLPAERGVLLKIFNWIAHLYITVIRGTPLMVQLLIMGFVIFRSSRSLVMVAILAMGINSAGYVAEIIRGGIMGVDKGQMEAGRSLGMKYATVMKDIIIPQATKSIFPALGNELITLFKNTSLVTVIGLADLTKVAIQIQARTYQAFMPFVGIALIYLAVVLLMQYGMGIIERRMRRGDRT